MSHRLPAWQTIVALAPLLVVAVSLPGELMVRCHLDGLLRPAPCCAHENEPPDPGPAFEQRDCCDREITATNRPLFDTPRATGGGHIPITAFTPAAASVAGVAMPALGRHWTLQRQGPAREGPPLVLVKHAFLI
jgi:hypothetical protein